MKNQFAQNFSSIRSSKVGGFLFWTLAAVSLGLVIFALRMPGHSFRQVPLFEEGAATEVVPLMSLAQSDGTVKHTLSFTIAGDVDPGQVEQLDILFGTYRTQPELISAKFETTDGSCKLVAKHGQLLEDNRLLRFEPKKECLFVTGNSIALTLHTKESAKLAVFGVQSQNPGVLHVRSSSGKNLSPFGYIAAQFNKSPNKVSRFTLLEKMWNESAAGDLWLETRFLYVLSCFLFAIGALFISRHLKGLLSKRLALASGYASLFCSLGLMYATITPPFEAPDEATHYRTYERRHDGDNLALKLAQSGSYDRIMCRTDQIFSLEDANSVPLSDHWPLHVAVTQMSSRSALGNSLWNFYRFFDDADQANERLWNLRRNNVFGISSLLLITLFFAYPLRSNKEMVLQAVAFAALLFPATIPNFGMHVSNHPITLAGYLMLMVMTPSLIEIGLRKSLMIPFGLAFALMLFSGRTGVLGAVCLAWLALAITCSYLVKQKIDKSFTMRKVLLSLALMLTPAAIFLMFFARTEYFSEHQASIWSRIHEIILLHQKAVFLGVFALFIVTLLPSFLMLLESRKSRWVAKFSKIVGVVLGICCVGLAILPLFHRTSPVPEIEFAPWDHNFIAFTKLAWKSYLGNLGWSGRDFFLFWSFWGGFGCPDRTFPDWIIQIFKLSVVFGWFCLGVSLFRNSRIKELVFTISTGAAAVLWFSAISYSAGRTSINLHGRFTLGFHLLTILVAFYGLYCLIRPVLEGKDAPKSSVSWLSLNAVLFVMLMSHGAAIWWHLYRFFGV